MTGSRHKTLAPPITAAMALIRREFLAQVCLWRTFIVIAGAALFLSLVAVLNWPRGDYLMVYQAQSLSQVLFSALFMSFWFAGVMLVTLSAAISVAQERERGTFALLRMVPMSDRTFLLGKLSGPLGLFMFLFCALLPFGALTLFLMGVDWWLLAVASGFTLLTTFTLATIGFAASWRSDSSQKAIVAALAEALTFLFLPLVLLWISSPLMASLGNWSLMQASTGQRLTGLSPLGAIQMSNFKSDIQWQSLLYQLLWLCQLGVRAFIFRPKEPRAVERSRHRSSPWRVFFSDSFHPISSGENPIRARIARYELFGFRLWGKVLGLLSLLVFGTLALAYGSQLNNGRHVFSYRRDQFFSLLLVILVTFGAAAPAYVVTLFTREYERDTFPLLRTTLCSVREQVFAPFRIALSTLKWPLFGALVPVLLLFCVFLLQPNQSSVNPLGAPNSIDFFSGLLTLCITLFFVVAFTQCVATLTRRTLPTLAVVYGAAIVTHISLLSLVFWRSPFWYQSGGFSNLVLRIFPWCSWLYFRGPVEPYNISAWALSCAVFLVLSFVLIGITVLRTARRNAY